ncbi:TPA: tryptophan-rich sensory protein [Streptococcus agalactiae]
MIRHSFKSKVLLLVFILTIIVNYLSATGFLTGNSQKSLSDRYQTLLTPAPLAFSIWSVIYLLTFLVILRAIFSKSQSYQDNFASIFPYFLGLLLVNNIWTVFFTSNLIGLSTIIIFAYCILLVIIIKILSKNKSKLLLRITFGIHAGWLLVASLVNLAVYLVKIDFNYPLPKVYIAIIALIFITVLSLYLARVLQNAYLILSVFWAWLMVFKAHLEGNFQHLYFSIQILSLIAAIILGVSFFIFGYYNVKERYKQKNTSPYSRVL